MIGHDTRKSNRLGYLNYPDSWNDFDDKFIETMSWDVIEFVNEKIAVTDNYLMPKKIYQSLKLDQFTRNDLYLRACYGESNLSRKTNNISDVVMNKAVPRRQTRNSPKLMHVFIGATLVDDKTANFKMLDYFEITQQEFDTNEFDGNFSYHSEEINKFCIDCGGPVNWMKGPSLEEERSWAKRKRKAK